MATVVVEYNRLHSARLEALLESIRGEVRRQLQARAFDGREIVATLSAAGIRRMSGDSFVVNISPADHPAINGWLAGEIIRRVGRSPLNLTVVADATVRDGVVIQDAKGLQFWDNRLLSRLERFWPELRRQIAAFVWPAGENDSMQGKP